METALRYEAGGTAAHIDISQTVCERLCHYFDIRAKIRRYIWALASGFDLGMLSPTWYLMKSEIRLLVSTNLGYSISPTGCGWSLNISPPLAKTS
jgi:hypothetical protein